MSTLFWDLSNLSGASNYIIACPPYLAFAVGVQCGQKFQFKVDTLENGVCLLKDGEQARMRGLQLSSRNTITGEDTICDYFISKCSDQALLGGDDAATVKEWRQIAASVTKYASS